MVTSPFRPQVLDSPSLTSASASLCSPPDLGLNAVVLPTTPLFGTDGIRGQVGDLLTAPLALQIGYWAGQVIKTHAPTKGPIILGQDSRNSSHMLATALSAGLTSAGLEVWNLGLAPTAAVAYLTSGGEAIGGIMISASHNPPEDNGVKFFAANGAKLSAAIQSEIEIALRQGVADHQTAPPRVEGWGQYHYRPQLINQYITFLHQPLQPGLDLSGMRIVLDMAWGAATRLADQVFAETGAEVIGLHSTPDGDRINVNCGSTHLAPLQAAVQQHQADIGFAFDGDADRVIAVDAQGRVVDGDYILYFWGKTLRQMEKLPDDAIISTVMANLGFERAWEQLGGALIRTPVGDQHVHAEMLRRGAKLGGEQSGHILCHHYSMTGDGILTALHIATLVRQADCALSDLLDQSFQTYPQVLKNVRVEDRERRLNWRNCDPLQRAIAQAEAAMGKEGRVLVRPSGTEPVIRVMVEAVKPDLVNHWMENLVLTVQKYLAI